MGVRAASLKELGDDFGWSLLDAAPDATLIVTAAGEIVFVNDHAAELFGWEATGLLGHVIEDLLPPDLRSVHRAHRTRYGAEPTNRAMGAALELRALRSDGSEVPVEISLNPLWLDDRLHVIAAVRDISERVEAEERMHRVLRTLDASDDGVFIFDAVTLRYSFVNEGACRLVGYGQTELLGMTPLHINPYTTETEYRRLIDQLVGGEDDALFRRSTLLRRDGTEVPVEKTLRTGPAGRDGTQWVIALARDISDRLAAEAELEASREAVADAERVVAVAEDRDRIARDLHDNVIQRLFAEGLNLQGVLAVLQDDRVRPRLESTVEALDETIKDLRTAIFSLHAPSEVAPGGLRGRLLDVMTSTMESTGIDPRIQFDGTVELMDELIAEALLPVLRESLTNVAKHANARSVRIVIEARETVTLRVTDDGVGVPDGVIGGHGLDNMRTRAEQLGGTMTIQSNDDRGSVLTWAVPSAPTTDDQPADSPTSLDA